MKDAWLMNVAILTAKNSYCKRSQVGAVLAKDNRIISTGWNGTPSKYDNECEENDVTNKSVIHSEANAILWSAREGRSTKGAILYVTLSPCYECTKMIIQAGIEEVVYLEEYRDAAPIRMLKKNNVKVRQYNETNK